MAGSRIAALVHDEDAVRAAAVPGAAAGGVAGDDRLVADPGAVALVLRLAVGVVQRAGALINGAAGFECVAPLHRPLVLAEDEDPAASEAGHLAGGLGALLLGDGREGDWLALQAAAGAGDHSLGGVGLGLVRGI